MAVALGGGDGVLGVGLLRSCVLGRGTSYFFGSTNLNSRLVGDSSATVDRLILGRELAVSFVPKSVSDLSASVTVVIDLRLRTLLSAVLGGCDFEKISFVKISDWLKEISEVLFSL